MKVSTTLVLSFVSLSAAAPVNSTPIEQTLQELERNAGAWRPLAEAGVPIKTLAGNSADQVSNAIKEIRKAVKESARAVDFANMQTEMDEASLRKAKRNLAMASQLLNPGNHTL